MQNFSIQNAWIQQPWGLFPIDLFGIVCHWSRSSPSLGQFLDLQQARRAQQYSLVLGVVHWYWLGGKNVSQSYSDKSFHSLYDLNTSESGLTVKTQISKAFPTKQAN